MLKRLLFLFCCIAICCSGCTFQTNQKNIVKLGYMLNITHATPIVGIEKEFFLKSLGDEVSLVSHHFIVGNNIIDAFITDKIDIAYIGPGPFINAVYRGVPVKFVENAANGGTVIVGNKDGLSANKKLKIAIPQYGNTQDLILRGYLEDRMINNVNVFVIPPQEVSTAFYTKSVDATCVPEPWGTVLTNEAMLKILEDEMSVFNNGNYPVTILIASKKFCNEYPEIIEKFKLGHEMANKYINENKCEAIILTQKHISQMTKKEIKRSVVEKAFNRCFFVNDLDKDILKQFVRIGVNVGYYKDDLLKNFDQYFN